MQKEIAKTYGFHFEENKPDDYNSRKYLRKRRTDR